MPKEDRSIARPRLETVNKALEELKSLVFKCNDINKIDFHKQWEAIINKHDINYNDLDRWHLI